MMWLWIVAGGLAYAGLMTGLLAILRSGGEADRRDRAAFRAWRAKATPGDGPTREGGRSAA